MVVTWTTFTQTQSRVEYGLLGGRLFEMNAEGNATLFVDSGAEKRHMFIHRVTLTGLKPAAAYGGWSCAILSISFWLVRITQYGFIFFFFSVSLWWWWRLERCILLHCSEQQPKFQSQVCIIWRSGQWEPSVSGSTSKRDSARHVWRRTAHR